MKTYEGSIAEIGTEDWSEPHRRTANNPESAAAEIIRSHLESGDADDGKRYAISVRETAEGSSDWQYFHGYAWAEYRAMVEILNPAAPK